MAGLLASGDHLFEALCDPALTLDEAIMLARTALKVEPKADVNVAKCLADQAHEGVSAAAATRLMEVLDTVSDGNRIMSSLLRLMRLTDKQVRSKAVLMIGRATRSVQWVRARFEDPDPRTRASAVEALWGCEGIDVRLLLRTAARDPHHRVSANALFGLYRMGETRAIPDLLEMASNSAPMFRTAAAWAMGEAGDRRFTEVLRGLMCDTAPGVRKRAFTSLGKVRSAVAKSRTGVQWRVSMRNLPPVAGARQLAVEVGPFDRGPLPKLVATQFIVSENGKVIHDYQVEERPTPEIVSLSYVFPRSSSAGSAWAKGALKSLQWKRQNDLWRTIYYQDTEEAATSKKAEFPAYSNNDKAVTAGLEKPPQKAECGSFWNVLRDSVRNGQYRGARRLIVYCPNDPGDPDDAEEIVSSTLAAQAAVHIVAHRPNPALKDLARQSRGSFHAVNEGDDLGSTMEETYQVMLARFCITYQSLIGIAESLQVFASNASGWGEKTLIS
ncbi:MAG TPA: HEAT repeat domain-containing protein [Bryobacteraceae bacterium]|nr:HEAT repeat domain-containing protein [Bryobacteraceae bacterium]